MLRLPDVVTPINCCDDDRPRRLCNQPADIVIGLGIPLCPSIHPIILQTHKPTAEKSWGTDDGTRKKRFPSHTAKRFFARLNLFACWQPIFFRSPEISVQGIPTVIRRKITFRRYGDRLMCVCVLGLLDDSLATRRSLTVITRYKMQRRRIMLRER